MSLITPEFLKKKAREISYALNRVSFYIKREELRNRLERLSFEFLENVAVAVVGDEAPLNLHSTEASGTDKQSLIKVFKNLSALDVLIRIGHSLYEIETVNSNILIRELDSFNSAIRQLGGVNSAIGNNSEIGNSANSFAKQDLNLESIFSMPPAVIIQSTDKLSSSGLAGHKNNSAIDIQTSRLKDFANIDNEKDIVERAYSKESSASSLSVKTSDPVRINQMILVNPKNGIAHQVRDESGNRTVRQNLISERVRQSGKINVKELIGQFPGVSERTLRYDLQRLCDQGVVEKVGSSGPGTSYITKNLNP